MTPIFEFLNQNAGALTVMFTAFVTVSTIAYAILTWRLVSETRKMREVQTEPKIHISTETHERALQIVYLKISNIGLGPAQNVKFNPRVISGGEPAEVLLKDLTASNFFNVGLRHFGPGDIRRSSYTEILNDFEGKTSSVLSFKVSYESVTGKRYSDEIIVDMSEIKDNYQIGTPDLHSIAKSLEAIRNDIGQIANGLRH